LSARRHPFIDTLSFLSTTPMNYVEITRSSFVRALTAAALRYDGLTFREIGQQLGGITVETARQAVLKGERIMKYKFAALNECAELIARGAQPQGCSETDSHS
jgi:hypothetical protein